jgi:sugar lactone lactonase YvrE
MLFTAKYLIFYVLCVFSITHLSAQYTTTDFVATNLISDGLNAPGRMAIDADDNIYVTDAIQKSIIKYNAQGSYISTINAGLSPLSIAINNKNQLFVGDQNTGDIYTIHSNGTKTKFYSGLSFPASMVFGSNNILYIVDSQQKKVIGLDVSGNVVKDFTYSSFTFPTGIAFDRQNNHIIVSEHGGVGDDVQTCGGGSMSWGTTGPLTTIYIFDVEGNYISEFGCFGTKDGEFQRIQGITVGTCGNIYAADPYLGRVSVFDPDGNYITKFGTQGDGSGEFNIPTDIVFSKDNRAFISSMNKGAVDVHSITFSLPTATITSADQTVCSLEDAAIEVQFTGTAPWTFTYTVDNLNPVELIANETPFSFPVSVEGLYKIDALTDGNSDIGTCFTGSTLVTVSSEPPTATINTTELVKCIDDPAGIELQFTGMAPWTFTYTIDIWTL